MSRPSRHPGNQFEQWPYTAVTKDTNLLVWTGECAEGPVDGVDYNQSVKVFGSVHIKF